METQSDSNFVVLTDVSMQTENSKYIDMYVYMDTFRAHQGSQIVIQKKQGL